MQYVYLATDEVLERNVALKVPMDTKAGRRFKRSATVSAQVNHPNVAKTLDYLEHGKFPILIEEYIQGSDLFKTYITRTERLDPYLVAHIMHHLAKGVAASHHVGVVHRDLKPSNIMISGGISAHEIKITDFGIAKMAQEEMVEASESITNSQTAIGALPMHRRRYVHLEMFLSKLIFGRLAR
jgi:serine/threonine-protein kinase